MSTESKTEDEGITDVNGAAVTFRVWGFDTDDPALYFDEIPDGLRPRQAIKLAVAIVDTVADFLTEKDKDDLANVGKSWSIGWYGTTLDEEDDEGTTLDEDEDE